MYYYLPPRNYRISSVFWQKFPILPKFQLISLPPSLSPLHFTHTFFLSSTTSSSYPTPSSTTNSTADLCSLLQRRLGQHHHRRFSVVHRAPLPPPPKTCHNAARREGKQPISDQWMVWLFDKSDILFNPILDKLPSPELTAGGRSCQVARTASRNGRV